MNKQPNTRTRSRSQAWVVTIMLATLGMIFSLAPSASTAAPVVSLDLMFFNAIGGGTSLYAVNPGAVLHTPEGDFVGRSGLTQFGDELESSFSNLEFSTTSVETAGSLTIVSFTLTGINTGEYHGMTSNCAGISVPGVAVLQMTQTDPWSGGEYTQDSQGVEPTVNRISEQWIGYDTDLITSQIGSSQYYANLSPGCAADDLPQQDAPANELPTACDSPLACRLPY